MKCPRCDNQIPAHRVTELKCECGTSLGQFVMVEAQEFNAMMAVLGAVAQLEETGDMVSTSTFNRRAESVREAYRRMKK